jgi:hypothetical protein
LAEIAVQKDCLEKRKKTAQKKNEEALDQKSIVACELMMLLKEEQILTL